MWPGVGHCAPLAGTSRLHRRAAYTRCLRCAGAPRRPASGSGLSLPFRPDMPSSLTPGSSSSHVSSCATPTRPSPRSERLGTPNTPAIRFTRGTSFEASLVRICYGLSGCSPPGTDLTEFPQPPGAFTSRLPAGWSPVPPLDMTTTASGLLCWRDFHPQEWQLASLHETHTWRTDARTRLYGGYPPPPPHPRKRGPLAPSSFFVGAAEAPAPTPAPAFMAATADRIRTVEMGAIRPLRHSWRARMSTGPEATNPKPSPAAPAIVVFGRDEAGKAHAAWFDQSEAALAEKAADF